MSLLLSGVAVISAGFVRNILHLELAAIAKAAAMTIADRLSVTSTLSVQCNFLYTVMCGYVSCI